MSNFMLGSVVGNKQLLFTGSAQIVVLQIEVIVHNAFAGCAHIRIISVDVALGIHIVPDGAWAKVQVNASNAQATKRCPHCLEMVKVVSNKCEMCGKEIK